MRTLYKRAKNGKISEWKIWVETDENDVPCICRESGYMDGKKNVKKRYVRKGTNVGKINEKTSYENACFIADNYYKDHIEQNFVDSLDKVDGPPKYVYPMLAKTYKEGMTTRGKKKGAKPIFPCYVQPKFDGVRCFTRSQDNKLWSRQLNEFENVPHIEGAVNKLRQACEPMQFLTDGEIYCHGHPFQSLISWVKRKQKNSKKLQYWIYDIPIPGKTYEERKKILDLYVPNEHAILKKVPTVKVNNHEELIYWHDIWVAEGYEGIILRMPDGDYVPGGRDYELMKYKNFEDDEFKVVDATFEEWDDTTNGVMRKLVVWVCETKDGERFNSRPVGSMMEREIMYKNREEFFGKMFTVRYQELSPTGVPIFNTGISFRDYE